MTEQVCKVTVNLTNTNVADIEYLHERNKKTKSQVIRDSIVLSKFVQDILDSGGKLLKEDKNGRLFVIDIK